MQAISKRIQRRSCSSEALASLPDLPQLLQQIYACRGIASPEQLDYSLNRLASYQKLKGLDAALALLTQTLEQQQRILIVGDFDADGATSTALAVSALKKMGAKAVDYLVPNRFEYGYGLTPEIVDAAQFWQPDLIITVDNGISSIAGVEAAKQAGIRVLITDHHLPGHSLPQADAIVNPNQPGCEFLSKAACGCAVVFYLLAALRARLRQTGWFKTQQLAEVNLAQYLDLVALATVADVVPLDHNNRILVQQGLARIRLGQARPGILALLNVANRQPADIGSADLGFALGPRLNAAGRLDDMSLGIECLLTEDANLARRYAQQLDELNQDRKQIEQDMQQQALAFLKQLNQQLKADGAELPAGLCLYDASWHQGVVGILASRIKDRMHRPVIAFAEVEPGELKGSARSIQGVHIRDLLDLIASRHPNLLKKFGGHAMAAGLSLKTEDFSEFSRVFAELIAEQTQAEDLAAVLLSDGELAGADLCLPLAQQLKSAGPWGQAFPEPLFDGRFNLLEQRLVGQKHLKMRVEHPEEKTQIDAIAFNVDLSQWPNQCHQVRLAYRLEVNEYRGRYSPQLLVEYLEPVAG